MFFVRAFLPGDKVSYIGDKYRDRLAGKAGWIHAPVENEPNSFVVEFPGTKSDKDQSDSDDYIMSSQVLVKYRASEKEKKQEGPEVQPRRRRRSEDEV